MNGDRATEPTAQGDERLRRVVAALDATGVPYELIGCDPTLADTATFCETYGFPIERAANAILVASKRPPGIDAVCIVLGADRLDVNRKVRDRLGVKKLSFASPEYTMERTGMEIGGVTPFGLPDDVPILVDEAVMGPDWVIFGAGTRAAKVKAAPSILLGLPGRVEIVDIAQRPS